MDRWARQFPALLLASALAISGCGGAGVGEAASSTPAGSTSADPTVSAPPSAPSAASPTPRPTFPANMADQPEFGHLEQETYYIVPNAIPVRVYFTVPGEGWVPWIGTYKDEDGAPYRHVGLTIINVWNLVTDGCTTHGRRNPPVGPTVDDLSTALTELPPFVVTKPPSDVTLAGLSGKHLELTIPELPVEVDGSGITYPECSEGLLKSWIGTPLSYAFSGYTEPGSREDLWILDVDGSRLVVSAIRSPESPEEDVAELRSLIDSIRIER